MADLQSDFSEAQRLYESGDYDRAARRFSQLARRYPEQPAMHHLLGLSRKKDGDLKGARRAFEAGIDRHPRVAALHAELASLLDDLEEWEAAVAAYDRAIALDPELVDARIDRALVRHKRISVTAGYEELRSLASKYPDNPRAWTNLAIAARQVGDMDEAKNAAERALGFRPDDARALRLRAQIALDRGETALPLFRKASRAAPDDPDIIRGEASALLAEGRAVEAQELLDQRLAEAPSWHDGHEMFARIGWEYGDAEGFTQTYRRALAERPGDTMLWLKFATTVSQTAGHAQALELLADAPRAVVSDPVIVNFRANSLCELDELDRAEPLFERLAAHRHPVFRLPLIRFRIRTREFEEVSRFGLDLAERGHGADAWPYVAIAWRMLEDPRWLWLEGERDLARAYDLDELEPGLDRLADRLRRIHNRTVEPFEQSLRGGTQTDGSLFMRSEPEIRNLVSVVARAVRRYIDGLPPHDDAHPVLSRDRSRFHFAGSWSVRLTDRGYHVQHIHNQGWISSALYVALPPGIDDAGGDRAGWLTLGEAPKEFGLDLAPLKLVKPEPARLALFPSIMWHGTRPFAEGERMTVAFDVASG